MRDQPSGKITWQEPLIDLICSIARHRRIVVIVVILGLTGSAFQYIRTPNSYRSSAVAVLLPREKPTINFSVTSSSMETAEEGAKRSDTGPLMLPPQTDLYLALLHSRAVLERVAEAHLRRLIEAGDVLERDRSDEVVSRLRSMVQLQGTEEGILTITVTGRDPELSAEVANALIQECQRASKAIEAQLLVNQAGHLEQAAETARIQLEHSEEALKQFSEAHGLIDPGLQATDRLRQIRDLVSVRDARQADLVQRKLAFTDADPGVAALRVEIDLMDRRVEELRETIAGDSDEREYGRMFVEYQGLQQELRFRRDLLVTLSTQSDIFRIRAQQPSGNIAVVRPAFPVPKPAGPSKKKIFGVGLGGSLLLAVGLALLTDQLSAVRGDAAMMGRLASSLRLHTRSAREPA
jgi:uncharacterized protein involved in exopolysaccharide biosynthesis